MLRLVLARLLILIVPFKYWRKSLGQASDDNQNESTTELPERVELIAKAVNRAAVLLPVTMVCLPRAMAVQWMAARRNFKSKLVFGILSGPRAGEANALHAWVEYQGVTIIGQDDEQRYHRGLSLDQG